MRMSAENTLVLGRVPTAELCGLVPGRRAVVGRRQ